LISFPIEAYYAVWKTAVFWNIFQGGKYPRSLGSYKEYDKMDENNPGQSTLELPFDIKKKIGEFLDYVGRHDFETLFNVVSH
jgi:hypothetical protein